MKQVNKVKDKIQKKGFDTWVASGEKSLLAMCTGSGKSRIGVMAAKHVDSKSKKRARILLVVPTETLRDEGWKNEFEYWGGKTLYGQIDRYCYVSINKIKKQTYDLVILDEAHRVTEANSQFFNNNTVKSIIALTATPPEDEDKRDILYRQLMLKISFNYPLEQGVKDGVVAPFDINVIELDLSTKRNFKVKPKTKDAYITSEKSRYDALTAVINKIQFSGKDVPMYLYLNRMRFIYDLPSKTEAAQHIIKKYFNKNERFLIFAGSIKQAEILCPYRYHSKTDSKDLDRLKRGSINRLSCIKALNEGENIPKLDSALIVQLTSKSLDLVQRVGRIVRIREGHRAKIWILSVINTKDEDWVNKALQAFPKSSITYTRFKNLV